MAARVDFRAYLQKKLIDSIECECYKRAKVVLHIGFVATTDYDIWEEQ